ncbi:MAG: TIGR03435 family protein [Acidobacteriaceae bacterium]|jgi:uncharacterized protein (TIGR03435 family)
MTHHAHPRHTLPSRLSLLAACTLLAIPTASTQPPPPPPPPQPQTASPAPIPTPAPQSQTTGPYVPSALQPHRHITFDVAVFKPTTTAPKSLVFPPGGDGFISTNRPIRDLIRYVYASPNVGTSFHFAGQPPWVDNDHYDIQAKVAPEDLAAWQKLDIDGQKAALADFLADWLKLKFHTDTRLYPFYALLVGKDGPKMQTYKPTDSFKTWDGRTVTGTALLWTSYNEVTAQGATMAQLCESLSAHADRIVLDHTGLTGKYNFKLQISFDQSPEVGLPDASNRPYYEIPFEYTAPSIFSSIRTLGLRLKPTKGPVDGLVIDHIQRPPEN